MERVSETKLKMKVDPVFDAFVQQVVEALKLWSKMMRLFVLTPNREISLAPSSGVIEIRKGANLITYTKRDIYGHLKEIVKAIKRLGLFHRAVNASRKRRLVGGGLTMPRIANVKVTQFIADVLNAAFAKSPSFKSESANLFMNSGYISMSMLTPLFVIYTKVFPINVMPGSSKYSIEQHDYIYNAFQDEFNNLQQSIRGDKYDNFITDVFVSGVTYPKRGFANTNLQTVVKNLLTRFPSKRGDYMVEYNKPTGDGRSVADYVGAAFAVDPSSLTDEQYNAKYEIVVENVLSEASFIKRLNESLPKRV